MRSIKIVLVLVIALALISSGCGSNKTLKGGAIGAAVGAAAGAAAGAMQGNTAKGAIIGAAIGGAAGALIGHYMDKQAEEMRNDVKNAKIERVGEGIKITFESGILFKVNSSELSSTAKGNISELARILNKYDDTNIL